MRFYEINVERYIPFRSFWNYLMQETQKSRSCKTSDRYYLFYIYLLCNLILLIFSASHSKALRRLNISKTNEKQMYLSLLSNEVQWNKKYHIILYCINWLLSHLETSNQILLPYLDNIFCITLILKNICPHSFFPCSPNIKPNLPNIDYGMNLVYFADEELTESEIN